MVFYILHIIKQKYSRFLLLSSQHGRVTSEGVQGCAAPNALGLLTGMSLPSPGDHGLVTDDSVSYIQKSFISLCVNFRERDKNLHLLKCNYDAFLFCNVVQQNRRGQSSPTRSEGQSTQPSALSRAVTGLQWVLREGRAKRADME